MGACCSREIEDSSTGSSGLNNAGTVHSRPNIKQPELSIKSLRSVKSNSTTKRKTLRSRVSSVQYNLINHGPAAWIQRCIRTPSEKKQNYLWKARVNGRQALGLPSRTDSFSKAEDASERTSERLPPKHPDLFSIFGELEKNPEVDSLDSELRQSALVAAPLEKSPSENFLKTENRTVQCHSAEDSDNAAVNLPIENSNKILAKADPNQTFMSLGVCYGLASEIGKRSTNEDRHVVSYRNINGRHNVACFGIFDGHGGTFTSDYLAKNFHKTVFRLLESPNGIASPEEALKQACVQVDDELFAIGKESGSTAIFCLVVDSQMFFASVGDSQAVLSTTTVASTSSTTTAIDLCVAHKPSLPSEQARIEAACGTVFNGRIFGVLSVSRAFGDLDFKTSRGEFKRKFKGDLVSSKPDVVSREVSRTEDEFVILACDGLFDVMTPTEAVAFVRPILMTGANVQDATTRLAKHAIGIGSVDNVSVIIIMLNQNEE